MKQLYPIVFLFLTANLVSAQTDAVKTIKGKVVSELIDLDGIYIVNLKTEAAAATEKEGYFTIKANIGDTLMFSAVQVKGKKIVVSEEEANKDLLLVKLEPMINRLDEVIVKQYKNINAVSLGIISRNTKHYSPAERKLKAASGADVSGNTDGTTGASVGVDPVFNWLSGRTAMLEKELEVEKKEGLLQRLENQFGLDYFVKKLKIPEEYVKGFWYFVVEDARFTSAFNARNKTMATFLLTELATKYIGLLKPDDK